MNGIIYLITNQLNNKKYVGKTYRTLAQRKQEHIRGSKQCRNKDRPLYRAFNKYGVENFKFETLHFTVEEDLEKMEIHYIRLFDTYRSGYNATLGGDGSRYLDLDEELIVERYLELRRIDLLSKEFGCSSKTIRQILISNDTPLLGKGTVNKRPIKIVETGEVFTSMRELADCLIESNRTRSSNRTAVLTVVHKVLKGKRPHYLGYTFTYIVNKMAP